MTTKSEHPYQSLSPKLKLAKQKNSLADYAKHISSEFV